MKKDKLRNYIIEILLIITLLFALFVSNTINKKILALIVFSFALLINLLIKKKAKRSIYDKQVTWLMSGFGFIYLVIFYLMGLYFGYYKAPTKFGFNTIINFIIPLTVIIVSSEFIRKKLINQKDKLSKILVSIVMVLIDLIIYTGVYDIKRLEDMLAVIGFVLFASYNNNWLFQGTANNYQWTITARSQGTNQAIRITNQGKTNNTLVTYSYNYKPVVYLKSTIKISDGIGSETRPFELSK